jgi:hypothetical protein
MYGPLPPLRHVIHGIVLWNEGQNRPVLRYKLEQQDYALLFLEKIKIRVLDLLFHLLVKSNKTEE